MPTMDGGKQQGNGLKIATAIASIIAVCGIGFGVYGMLQSSQKDKQISDLRVQIKNSDGTITTIETPQIETTTSDGSVITISDMPESIDRDSEVKQIVKQIYEAIGKDYTYKDLYTGFGDGYKIKIPNTDIYTYSNRSYGVLFTNMESSEPVEKRVNVAEATLRNNGFSEDMEVMSGKNFYNSNNGITCGVSYSAFIVKCSKDTWIADEDKELSVELAKVADVFYMSASPSKIVDSQVSPYQNITASGPNAAYLFYRTSPSSEWQFFTGAQDILSCSRYVGDVAKAFAGEKCWDETADQMSTVQP